MSQYRDHLDAARARIETLEAKLKERDAALAARDAELAEVRAEIERLRGGSGDDGPHDGRGGQRALFVALAVCGFATATGYAVVRPTHCMQRSITYPATVEASPRGIDGHAGHAMLLPARRGLDAERVRLGRVAGAAIERGKLNAQACWQLDGPRGEGSVTVVFAPSGDVEVELGDDAPYAGTEVGDCVVDAFRSAAPALRAFDGEPLRLTTHLSL
ncbi:hypothetical protein WMF31_04470 [Sorangium sp. So ce1036]|uniref:hypothetical protein n=1 Tax=Sorangium sp. So ce1036 TaxID=3133328 RepID=UPI003F065ECB